VHYFRGGWIYANYAHSGVFWRSEHDSEGDRSEENGVGFVEPTWKLEGEFAFECDESGLSDGADLGLILQNFKAGAGMSYFEVVAAAHVKYGASYAGLVKDVDVAEQCLVDGELVAQILRYFVI
jgi:hypothetical protein